MTEEIHNAYQTLELPIGANLPQAQKAWREMVQVWHPDRFPHNPDLQSKAQERTKQINNAYDILKRYLKDGEIPRSRPRPSKQSKKQESQQQTRRPRSRPSKQSKKQESQKQTRQTRSRSSKQSQKQENQQRTRQQETASEDAQSSQTHEQENRQKQTTKPFQEKSLAAKIGGIIRIIFAIISGYAIGGFIGMILGALGNLPFLMIGLLLSGWSIFDRIDEPMGEDTFFFYMILVPFIVIFFGRIIDTICAKRQRKPFIGIHEDWFAYTTIGMCGGAIGCSVCGTPVILIGNEAISSNLAAFIGAAVGARLACRWYVRRHLEEEK